MTADRYARSPRVAHSEQEHRLSLRAELVRLGLRWFVKRWSSRKSTVAAMRRRVAVFGLLVPLPPMGTAAKRVDLDGVKAVSVATEESLGDRHILYLHGGGHVAGKPALYRDFIWRIAAAARARGHHRASAGPRASVSGGAR